ncbi:hypothetical protein KSS87_000945 [Heliosperma pusillum]|nr:hypothetical protein KSS87_000945 [Heliosperma pusillum]
MLGGHSRRSGCQLCCLNGLISIGYRIESNVDKRNGSYYGYGKL